MTPDRPVEVGAPCGTSVATCYVGSGPASPVAYVDLPPSTFGAGGGSTALAARPDDVAGEMLRHAAVAAALAEAGERVPARDAAHVAAALALRLATAATASAGDHGRAVEDLRACLDTLGPAVPPDLPTLLDAGLEADASRRLSHGLPPFGGRMSGWLDGPHAAHAAARPGRAAARWVGPRDDRAHAAASAARDVDLALAEAIRLLRELIASSMDGPALEDGWSSLAGVALALCVEPAASRAVRTDRRRVLLMLWRTLRRRRPQAAAVLRRRLALDRRAWPGPTP